MLVREIRSDFNLQHRGKPRTPGQHVSEVIRDIALAVGVLKQDDREELDWTLAKYRLECGDPSGVATMFPVAIYRVAAGLAWEEWLGEQRPEINFHSLGELERDGLIGTPDGLSFEDGVGTIHEIKLTWKSSRSNRQTPQERIAVEWLWHAQLKAYCYMASQPGYPVTRANLHVYWVNGNYKGSGPEFRTYEVTFTEEELAKNWKLISQTSKRLKDLDRQGRTRKVA